MTVRRQTISRTEAEELGLPPREEWGVIEVSDAGIGIPPENVGYIFDPFFTTKEKGKGTGLGLSIAYGIVQQHRGAISVKSMIGEGATFAIYLPLAAAAAAMAGSKGAAPQHDVPQRGTILVVEDDPTVLLLVRKILERSGYQVVTATTGEDALAVTERNDIDAVVSDVLMPKMSGMELHQALRMKNPDLVTILMSGYSDDVVPRELSDEIIFLQKPVPKETLLQAVRTVLRKE